MMSLKEFVFKRVFKRVVLGNSAVGKTSLINQYVKSTFQEDYKPTLGANIIRKDVDISGNKIRLIKGNNKYIQLNQIFQ